MVLQSTIIGHTFRLIDLIVEQKGTSSFAEELKSYINTNQQFFHDDYLQSSGRIRHATGRYERILVFLLGWVCLWSTQRIIINKAKQIMIMLGYLSYADNNRFRQKMENLLKKYRRLGISLRDRRQFFHLCSDIGYVPTLDPQIFEEDLDSDILHHEGFDIPILIPDEQLFPDEDTTGFEQGFPEETVINNHFPTNINGFIVVPAV